VNLERSSHQQIDMSLEWGRIGFNDHRQTEHGQMPFT
jgi:hypothetical protein